MTKRAAMILAGLVAAAVLAGGGALAGRVAGSVPGGSTGVEPVVREVRRTVTVQREAAAPSGGAVQVIALPQGAAANSALARSPEPRPPADARRVEVIRRLVRRIVVVEERARETPVRYVVAGGASGGLPPVTWTRGS
jgi:hypothetical protein